MTNYHNIAALKVFEQLGQLIDEDKKKITTFHSIKLPNDIMQKEKRKQKNTPPSPNYKLLQDSLGSQQSCVPIG